MLNYDLVVIGGGPGGYYAAVRAAQKGLKVCVVEKESLGGTCLNVGCIPTKALHRTATLLKDLNDADMYGVEVKGHSINLKKVLARKDEVVSQLVGGVAHLLKKHKIDLKQGEGRFVNDFTVEVVTADGKEQLQAKNIIIATGSVNAKPPVPGMDGKDVIDSTDALSPKKIPQSIAIIGGGVIGSEFAGIYRALGSEVYLIEMLPHLISGGDPECSKVLEKSFVRQGVNVEVNTKVLEVKDENGLKVVNVETPKGSKQIKCETVLVATGRKANIAGLDLEKANVAVEKSVIKVDAMMRTSNPKIYAIGDVNGKDMLAHVAYEEAEVAVENILGGNRTMDYNGIPKAIFTFPEIAMTGMTEEEAKAQGLEVVVGKFPMRGNGKALIANDVDGFIKFVAEKETRQILGVHICGPHASDLSGEASLAIKIEATLDDIEAAVHAHPTVSEAIREAAMATMGRAIHA